MSEYSNVSTLGLLKFYLSLPDEKISCELLNRHDLGYYLQFIKLETLEHFRYSSDISSYIRCEIQRRIPNQIYV